jgi:uncharacterized protein YqiB (DUF1249 family)
LKHKVLADSLIVPQCVYRPGSFTGLMTLYESNYLKLGELLGDSNDLSGRLVSRSAVDFDLHLELLRRDRYTTTLKMTYWFDELVDSELSQIADPDLTIRIYHDARLVDVVWSVDRHRHYKLQERASLHGTALGARWRSNIMLNKWLDYLLEMQHRF